MRTLCSRAAAILRDSPAGTLPLSMLRERLRDEALYDGGAAALLAVLQRRTDLFATVRPAPALADEPGWSETERLAYRAALADAGMSGEVRITLVVPPADGAAPLPAGPRQREPLLGVETDVLALWNGSDADERLRRDLSTALREIERMRAVLTQPEPSGPGSQNGRTTIPPRGPRRRR
jgi:hypothetical protein